jgi:rhodanese-related sulfurtransferase
MANVAGIEPRALDELLGAPAPVILLDVREPEERAFAAIDGARAAADLFVPLGTLTERVTELQDVLQDNAFVVVYCHHGMRSMLAANWLAQQGLINVLNLTGGIDAWSAEVDRAVPRY